MINPTTHAFSSFALPNGSTAPREHHVGLQRQPLVHRGQIAPDRRDQPDHPRDHRVQPLCRYLGPNGITAGPDGNVWFAWEGGGEVGKINPTTDAITYYSGVGATGGDHRRGRTATSGSRTGDVGKINPTTGAISTFATPTPNAAQEGITAGPDGNLWFTETTAGKIAQINPTTDAITEYPIPYAGSSPYGITAGPDGNLWFTDPGTNAIGVATLATSQLVVTQQPPASVTAGSAFGLTVDAENSSGNLLSSFDGTVTVALASNPGGATLGGTLTATASNGVATFSNLSLTTAASGYTLVVSGGGLGEGITSAITVTPAAASQVVITQQPPASVTAGSGFGLQATIEDAYGNVETGDNSDVVTAALASNPGGTTLGGTLSVTVSQGVATFSGLTLTKAAAGYTLGVSSTGPGERDLERHHRDTRGGHAGGDHRAAARQRRRERRFRPDRVDRRRLRQRGDVGQQHREGGARQQPRRGETGRNALGEGERRRGHVLGADAEQGRNRLHAPAHEQRAEQCNHEPDQRDHLGRDRRTFRGDCDHCTRSVVGAAGARQPGNRGRPGNQEAHEFDLIEPVANSSRRKQVVLRRLLDPFLDSNNFLIPFTRSSDDRPSPRRTGATPMSLRLSSGHRFSSQDRQHARTRRNRRPLALEGLEGRVLLSGNPTYYTVNLTSDTGASSGTDAATGTPSGDILWAVTQANANTNPAGSVIEFDPTVFSESDPRTIVLTSTLELGVSSGPMVIGGPGAGVVTISGGGSVGVFQVDGGAVATLSGLTITDGLAAIGGGVNNGGMLALTDCVIESNTGVNGGGIGSGGPGATMTITGCTIDDNTATAEGGGGPGGGGIYNGGYGIMTVTNSIIENNSETASLGYGGGILNGGTLTLTDSTIAGNTATDAGGGAFIWDGLLTVTDCTINNNSANSQGGGGICVDTYGALTISDSTIADNTTSGYGGGIAGDGTIIDCTLKGNTANVGGGLAFSGTITSSTIVGNTGGGIYNFGTTTVIESTIADNTTSGYGGGINNDGTFTAVNTTIAYNETDYRIGGGVYDDPGSTTTLYNTIVAVNTRPVRQLAKPDDIAGMPGFPRSVRTTWSASTRPAA